jgi:hypothetical protein
MINTIKLFPIESWSFYIINVYTFTYIYRTSILYCLLFLHELELLKQNKEGEDYCYYSNFLFAFKYKLQYYGIMIYEERLDYIGTYRVTVTSNCPCAHGRLDLSQSG